MKVTFKSSYVSKKGNPTFVGVVSGTPEEIAEYKKDRGDGQPAVCDEQGNPLFFNIKAWGKGSANLIKTRAGKYIVDNSELMMAASIASQYGGNLGQALANAAASQFQFGSSATTPVTETAPAVKADLNKLD